MIVIIPVHATIRAIPVIILMVLLFVAGSFLGWTAVWLFTAPVLLEKIHLWAIPMTVATVVVMGGLVRQMFRNGDDAEMGFFATHGRSTAVVVVFALLALAGGAWLGVFAAMDQRAFFLAEIHNRQHTKARARAAATGVNVVAARASGGPFRLQGIFFNTTKPSAVLNHQTVFVGDNVGGWRVKGIEPKRVILEREDSPVQVLELK